MIAQHELCSLQYCVISCGLILLLWAALALFYPSHTSIELVFHIRFYIECTFLTVFSSPGIGALAAVASTNIGACSSISARGILTFIHIYIKKQKEILIMSFLVLIFITSHNLSNWYKDNTKSFIVYQIWGGHAELFTLWAEYCSFTDRQN